MKSIEYHYTNLVHTIQRNLYHTDAPLAKQSSMSLGQISEALIHREITVTKTYLNTPNVIKILDGEMVYFKLFQENLGLNSDNDKKVSQIKFRNA